MVSGGFYLDRVKERFENVFYFTNKALNNKDGVLTAGLAKKALVRH